MKSIAVIFAFTLASIAGAQENSGKHRHWHLSASETLWEGRYSNCQYGYYVLLPEGVIAHAEHPPNPHHGFLINLPDVGSKAKVSMDHSGRFLWVNAKYNATDNSALSEISADEMNLSSSDKQHFRLINRQKTSLGSTHAIRYEAAYDTPKGRVIEEELVALRSGIVYEIGLRTPAADYPADRERLEETLTGFRFSRSPDGTCRNY